LTALQMNLDLLAHDQPTLPEGLKSSMALVDDLVDQVRTLSLELRPTVLDELGLAAALEWYCQQQIPRLGLQVYYTGEPVLPRPSPAVETACFRVVQEAVTNVARHAQTQKVWIILRQEGGELHLTVRDEGVGFNVETSRKGSMTGVGLGLQGMDERVQLIEGRLDIRSAPGYGTEIHVWVPLTPSASQEH
jgi:signal transduction histidine kinase